MISCSGKVSRVLRNNFVLLVLLLKHSIAFLQKWNGKKKYCSCLKKLSRLKKFKFSSQKKTILDLVSKNEIGFTLDTLD